MDSVSYSLAEPSEEGRGVAALGSPGYNFAGWVRGIPEDPDYFRGSLEAVPDYTVPELSLVGVRVEEAWDCVRMNPETCKIRRWKVGDAVVCMVVS